MKFGYVKLGQAVLIGEDDQRHPIKGNYIQGVTIGGGEHRRVLGLVQQNPTLPNEWRAVASLDPNHFPTVDFERGLWNMTPGRSGFRTRKEACLWLLGVSDGTQAAWFAEAVREGS